jgi:hypothetical protein
MKNSSHAKWRTQMGEEEQKKGVKKVNMVDALSTQNEYRIFKPAETP